MCFFVNPVSLRDLRGAHQLRKAQDVRSFTQETISVVQDCRWAAPVNRSMAYGYCHLSAVWVVRSPCKYRIPNRLTTVTGCTSS